MSIKTKILLLLAGISLSFSLIIAIYSPNQSEKLAKSMLIKDAEFISNLLAENLALGMQTKDFDSGTALEQALQIIRGDSTQKDKIETIYNVQIFDANQEFVKSLIKNQNPSKINNKFSKLLFSENDEHIIASLPMKDQTKNTLGYLQIYFSKKHLTSETNKSQIFMLIMALIILLVSLGVGYYIVNSIVSSIKQIIQAAESVSLGDLNAVIDIHSKDETKLLGNSLAKTIATLKELISEIQFISEANANGHLDKRGDASKFQGAYYEIIAGINASMNSVISPLNVAAEYIDRIAKGDIPLKIVDEYKGDFNGIKNNINQCIDSLNGLIKSMLSTTELQKAGDIDAFSDEMKFTGVYRELINGYNVGMQVHINALMHILNLLNEYANGDLTNEMFIAPGKQIIATEIINKLRQNILALSEDASMLSNSAMKGRLDTRVDAAKHQGVYGKIIEGMNTTLSNVVGFFEAIPTPIQFMDKDFKIQYINNTGSQLLGLSKEQLKTKTCAELWKTKKCATKECPCYISMDKNHTFTCTNECMVGNDNLDIFCAAAPLLNEEGNVIGSFEFVMDQTEISKAARNASMISEYQSKQAQKLTKSLGQLSKGDLSFELEIDEPDNTTQEVFEVFSGIVDSINQSKAAIIALTTDANMLSEATVEGRLDIRANVNKHNGDYRKIVEGVNHTLDAVIRPLNVAAEYIDRIAKGDIPPKIIDHYNGDFNGIKNNLNQCIDAIAQLVDDASMLSNYAIEGNLDNRADEQKHNGDFRKLVAEMNHLMNAIAEPIGETSTILAGMSVNDFEIRYQSEYKGVWQEMRKSTELAQSRVNSFIKIITNISNGDISDLEPLKTSGKRSENDKLVPAGIRLMEAIQGVINVMIANISKQKAGDIEAFADASKFPGEYSKLIAGYNEGMQIHINTILEILNLLDEYANGDLSNKLPILPGKQIIATERVNKLRQNVLNLITDSNMLSTAAVQGKLDTRADASEHQGDFRKIIEGVNHTLDAIIHPLNVSAEYMDRIAKGDIPPKINEQYSGDFNEIKNNLNQCIDSINLLIIDANGLAEAAINGDTTKRADISKHNGDYRKIIQGFNNTLDATTAPITEAVNIMELMAQGDMSHLMEGDFKGNHAVLKQTLNSTLFSINQLLQQVNDTVAEVLNGSMQVVESSHKLSGGASEQAAAIEEMSSSMMQIASQTKQNANNARNANSLADNSQKASERGFSEMQQLQIAMSEINESSKNIAKIIKVIDEIAFQTNLLALNAAVEAARAGVHGQGFAVVAEEVRNLARRSAEAAKETAVLIEGSIKRVDNGTMLSEKTATVLKEIREQSTSVAELIKEIAIASNEQANGINQIEIGFMQIDKVTQQNTAGSEKSASIAEELAEQAKMVEEILSGFVLNKTEQQNLILKGRTSYYLNR